MCHAHLLSPHILACLYLPHLSCLPFSHCPPVPWSAAIHPVSLLPFSSSLSALLFFCNMESPAFSPVPLSISLEVPVSLLLSYLILHALILVTHHLSPHYILLYILCLYLPPVNYLMYSSSHTSLCLYILEFCHRLSHLQSRFYHAHSHDYTCAWILSAVLVLRACRVVAGLSASSFLGSGVVMPPAFSSSPACLSIHSDLNILAFSFYSPILLPFSPASSVSLSILLPYVLYLLPFSITILTPVLSGFCMPCTALFLGYLWVLPYAAYHCATQNHPSFYSVYHPSCFLFHYLHSIYSFYFTCCLTPFITGE